MKYIFYVLYSKTCGYRRLHSELHDRNFKISEKKVKEKMKELNLVCEIRRKKPNKNYEKNTDESIKTELKNILGRNFIAIKPNQKYCTDTTEIETIDDGRVNCSVIIDLFNIAPFGLEITKSCNTELSKASVKKLNTIRNLEGCLLHSDQGVTYTSKSFCDLLTQLNITQSMSKKGCPYDNSPMENFWGTLKVEKINRLHRKPKNIEELKEIIEEYIEFYMNIRKNSKLNYLTPLQYYDNYMQRNK